MKVSILIIYDKNIIINQSTFDIANIIALETMPHVATKADWDAIDNSNEFKYDYLIEESNRYDKESENMALYKYLISL